MKNKTIIFISFLSLLAVNSFAQSGIKKADKQYAKYAYIDATETYERVAGKGYKSADMFMKLGNTFACFMTKKIVFSQVLQLPAYKSIFYI